MFKPQGSGNVYSCQNSAIAPFPSQAYVDHQNLIENVPKTPQHPLEISEKVFCNTQESLHCVDVKG